MRYINLHLHLHLPVLQNIETEMNTACVSGRAVCVAMLTRDLSYLD